MSDYEVSCPQYFDVFKTNFDYGNKQHLDMKLTRTLQRYSSWKTCTFLRYLVLV